MLQNSGANAGGQTCSASACAAARASTTAGNRPRELRVHLRAALTYGVTENEIREVLLQTAVYCGMRAALDSFRIAREVLDEAKTG
jgi:alkylhydroperoxidase/carboxymuconolactone decarboxylase family protein YurZ